MLRFLIDECLSPRLAGKARELGFQAFHVNWLDQSGWRDQVLAVYAVAEDFVLVTNNGADFKPIYRALDVHPGLVILLPSVRRDTQVELFERVLHKLASQPDLINKLIEVDVDGDVIISDFPPSRNSF